jgi:hypothetical protein
VTPLISVLWYGSHNEAAKENFGTDCAVGDELHFGPYMDTAHPSTQHHQSSISYRIER